MGTIDTGVNEQIAYVLRPILKPALRLAPKDLVRPIRGISDAFVHIQICFFKHMVSPNTPHTTASAPPAADKKPDARPEIAAMVERARLAMEAIEHYSQAEADELVLAIGWHVVKSKEALAKLAVEEGGFGNYNDKIAKIRLRVTGTIRDMQGVKTVGIVEDNPAKGLVKIAKPVGVVAAIIPSTGPDATPPMNALCALKGKNAIIVAAHPKTQKTSELAVNLMRQGCKALGVPEDLIQIIQQPSIAKTQELMRQADLIVATSGVEMVWAAYSSGTPAFGVSVGNTVHVVGETADLDCAAIMIARGKTFDYATSCLADNASSPTRRSTRLWWGS